MQLTKEFQKSEKKQHKHTKFINLNLKRKEKTATYAKSLIIVYFEAEDDSETETLFIQVMSPLDFSLYHKQFLNQILRINIRSKETSPSLAMSQEASSQEAVFLKHFHEQNPLA